MTLRPVGRLGLRLSVIVTTYNQPRALTLVLAGLGRQSLGDFEVLIADDGSGPETAAVIAGHSARAPFPIRHVWHPDEGFRKCAVSNQAIQEAAGDYLIFFDGDCIPTRRCLEIHVRSARRDGYLAGGAVSLPRRFGERLTPELVSRGALDRVGTWWREVNKPQRLVVSRIP
nr:glycosyltransferase [Gemmatimonadales bacterium]